MGVRPMKDGNPGFVVDGTRDGEMARLRPLDGGTYALAASAGPGTFPVEIVLDVDSLRSFVEHARWLVDGPQ